MINGELIMKILLLTSKYIQSIGNCLFNELITTCKVFFHNLGHNIIIGNNENINEISNNYKFDFIISPRGTGLDNTDIIEKWKKNKSKIFLFFDDIHYYNEHSRKARHNLFKLSDVLLLTYYDHFLKMNEYRHYHHKAVDFPFFFPTRMLKYNIPFDNKVKKIFLSGRISPRYDFRQKIFEYAKQNLKLFYILKHPGYLKNDKLSHDIIGPKYYKIMATYKAAIATSANKPLDYMLAKYFEIPGMGCIPIFQEIESLKKYGFYKNVHYISLEDLLLNNDFSNVYNNKQIVDKCQSLIINNHSDIVRVKYIHQLMKDI